MKYMYIVVLNMNPTNIIQEKILIEWDVLLPAKVVCTEQKVKFQLEIWLPYQQIDATVCYMDMKKYLCLLCIYIDGLNIELSKGSAPHETSCNEDSFLSIDMLVSLWWSLRNSTAMNVRADAGIYHAILGMLPLNIPLGPSACHTL